MRRHILSDAARRLVGSSSAPGWVEVGIAPPPMKHRQVGSVNHPKKKRERNKKILYVG